MAMASLPGAAAICRPIGKPSSLVPQGTVIAGRPSTLNGRVLRSIWNSRFRNSCGCAADAAVVLAAIAGYDEQDLASRVYPQFTNASFQGRPARKLRVGVAREMFFDGVEAEVLRAVEAAINTLSREVAEAREVTVPIDSDRTVHVAEAFAYHQPLLATRAQQYHPETLRRIRNGESVSAAQYIAKQRELESLRRSVGEVFSTVDVMVTPTVPMLPPTFAELEGNPEQLRPRELLMLRNTRPFNVLGTPAVSLPCGNAGGLPVGIQISGRPGEDLLVLAAAEELERALPRRRRLPEDIG